MRSLTRLAAAIGLTALVAMALPLAIAGLITWDDRPDEPAVRTPTRSAVEAAILQRTDEPAPVEATQASCRVTLAPGDDVGAAVAAQPIGGVVCLARGVHRPFVVARSVSAGVTVRGEGAENTTILAQRGDAVAVTDVERFTLAGVTLRGGAPAGLFAARARGLALREVRIQGGSFGLHADDGSSVTLDDVTITAAGDFGLLVRRRSTVTGERVRVLESRAIGVGVVDGAGSLTLRGGEIGRTDLPGPAEALVAVGAGRVLLEDVSVRGGNPTAIYAARVPDVRLRGVRVEGAVFGVHVDDGAVATLEDVVVAGSAGVGLLLQAGASVTGDRLRVLDTAGTGVSAINNAAALTLRDSEIGGTQGAGIFAGIAGCASLPPGSLFVPECFLADPPAFVGTTTVALERVGVRDTSGPGVVLFPGVRGTVRDSTFNRCEFTGLFAWGASVDVTDSAFADNAEHALEYRAYPDPRAEVLLEGGGAVTRTIARATRPLASGGLGGGILAQGVRLAVLESDVSDNADIGVSYQNGASGEVAGSRIAGNGGIGLCIAPGTSVTVRDTVVAGNARDGANACGGLGG